MYISIDKELETPSNQNWHRKSTLRVFLRQIGIGLFGCSKPQQQEYTKNSIEEFV